MAANEPEEDVNLVDITRVEADGMRSFSGDILEGEEVVGHLRGTSHLTGALQTQDEEVENEAIVLDDE